MRVLAFAAEAWEATLLRGVLVHPLTEQRATYRQLALTDSYIFQYEKQFLANLRGDSRIRLTDYQGRFESWQQVGPPPSEPPLQVEAWLDLTRSLRSQESLLACDTILTPWEYGPCLLPLRDGWRHYIAADLIDWTLQQFDSAAPDVVICVERRRLATATAQIIADAHGIPMLCLSMSRLDNRWVVRRDLGYGMSEDQLAQILAFEPSATDTAEARQILGRIRGGRPAYSAPSMAAVGAKSPDSVKAWKDYVGFVSRRGKHVISRHLRGGARSQSIRSRRYEQAFARMSVHEAIVESRRFRLLMFRRPFCTPSDDELRRERYVYFALHARPEDANSALGDGLDEVEAIEQLSQALGAHGVRLVVKENPLMIGWRESGFYKRLLRQGVILASPEVPSASLLMHAKGVAGLSGTALLESAIVGVPVIAFGKPEFVSCLNFQGPEELDAFVQTAAGNLEPPPPRLDPEHYVSWIVGQSDADDLPFLHPLGSREGAKMIQSVSRRFWRTLDETVAP